LNKHSFTDLYDSQGRLTSIGAGALRSVKPALDISIKNQDDHPFVDLSPSITTIQRKIEEILLILSRNGNIDARQSCDLRWIGDFLGKYVLEDYSVNWSSPLLKRLYHNVSSIKQLLEENENGENYDRDYLNILFTRVEQRARNMDFGNNFREDQPYIIEQLEYEDVLDERRNRKHLLESLVTLNERFAIQCSSYVQKCIDLHSHVRIMGIGNNKIGQLATRLNLTSMTPTEKEYLSKKCDSIVIPLRSFVSFTTIDSGVPYHCNKLSLMESQRHSLTDNYKQQTLVNNNRDLYRLIAETPFLPSSQFESNCFAQNRRVSIENVSELLEKYRWIVFLGDPGSAKTTLVRWLTLQCAKKFIENRIDNKNLSARLPVLVRVGEIATALDRNASLSLLDCLCQPTWFGTSLIQTDYTKSFIREYIKHGHALIILDGLDEIPNFRQRQHIVRLIEQFLQEWTVCPVTFIAPFDRLVSTDMVVPLFCSTVGNQVIITSRIVGYYLCPITASRIKHYLLAPLSLPLMNSFIDHWFQGVHSSLEISKWASSKSVTKLSALGDELKSMLIENEGLQKLTSNSMMLGVLCTLNLLQCQQEMLRLRKQKIYLLDSLSQFTLRLSLRQTEEAKVNLDFLIDIALHLHERSPSGLVEELDMKNILRKSINHREDIIDNFIRLIDSETCLFVPRGLCIYGFSHLTYEEYYVCLYIVRVNENGMKNNRLESVAHQFHCCALYGSRFREPLILALSYISWKWSETDYNSFCNSLLNDTNTSRFSDLVPLGAICLLSSISELVRLPSTEILCTMLNQCIGASTKNKWFDHFPAFVEILKTALNELPLTFIREWFLKATDEVIDAVSKFILRLYNLPQWFDLCICQHMLNQLILKNRKIGCCLFPFIASLNKTLLPKNDLCQYMIVNEVQIENIHPLILTVIICLCGGLTKSTTDQNIVVFSSDCMHRHSEYLSILTQNLYSDPQVLLNYCHAELLSKSASPSLDLLVMYCCLEGCKDELLTWPLIQRLQQLALYVCSIYLGKKYAHRYETTTDQILTLLTPLIDCGQQDNSPCSSSLIVMTALSRFFAVRETDFPIINLPYKLCHLDVEQLNSDLFILSRSFQPDFIPKSYRHLLSSQSLSLAHRIFLSAAYIIELSIDAYERWYHSDTRKLTFTEDSIQEVLTVEVAHWIHVQIQLADGERRYQLSQALHRCKTFIDVETSNILTQWLSYGTDSYLRQFAYHAALLLFNLNRTATVLCFQLLGSELDDFRRRSEELFKNHVLSSWRLGVEGLISLTKIGQHWTTSAAAHILESFNTIRIRLERIHCLNSLYVLLENIEAVNILESFSFIFDPSIQPSFITKVEHCHTAAEDYIVIILKIFSHSKGKWNKFEVSRGTAATFRLLRKYSISIQIANAALEVFTRWRSYNYITHIALQTYYPEITRIRAIRWLYRSHKHKHLRIYTGQLESKASASIINAAWEGALYLNCFGSDDYQEPTAENLLECCDNDYLRLFRALIALLADNIYTIVGESVYGLLNRIFPEICTDHKFENIDTVFVDIICTGLLTAQNNPFSTLSDTHLALVVKYIKRREVEFFRAVQNSVLGETGFKNALIIISKKSDVSRRLAALNLLVRYGELTIGIAQIFLDSTLERLFDQQCAVKLIWRLKRIPNKQTSDYLLEKLKNESLQQRYMVALLLVQLAVNDQISKNTVCICIKNIINDPTSGKDIYLTLEPFTIRSNSIYNTNQKGRLDHALATLLMQFSFIAGKPSGNEFRSDSSYLDLYLNYNHLFEQIRKAPRLVSCSYKMLRQRHHISGQSIDDDLDSETIE
jgi:hypothetical protein